MPVSSQGDWSRAMRDFIEATWILVGFWIAVPWVLLTVLT